MARVERPTSPDRNEVPNPLSTLSLLHLIVITRFDTLDLFPDLRAPSPFHIPLSSVNLRTCLKAPSIPYTASWGERERERERDPRQSFRRVKLKGTKINVEIIPGRAISGGFRIKFLIYDLVHAQSLENVSIHSRPPLCSYPPLATVSIFLPHPSSTASRFFGAAGVSISPPGPLPPRKNRPSIENRSPTYGRLVLRRLIDDCRAERSGGSSEWRVNDHSTPRPGERHFLPV